MAKRIPMVGYLVIDGADPHLVANECTSCSAVYLDRRNACARCGRRDFRPKRLPNEGTLRSFTIVHRGTPGVPTPFVSAIVDLGEGAVVKANLVGVEPDPAAIKLGAPVKLTTFVAGTDDEGTEAVAFAYAPA
jgi:uncharacterized OB-fold protein